MQSLNTNELYAEAGRRDRFFFRHFLLFVALLFCLFQCYICKIYGFIIYPDEFGYWACAGRLLGYDWSEAVSLGYYYSFGYSLVLAPVLRIFQDSITAYRAAIAVNGLMQCAAVPLLWSIYKRLYVPGYSHHEPEVNGKKKQIIVATGIAVFYPAWSFYAQTTMAEALMTFMFAVVCHALLAVMEKPNITRTILLILSLLYLYFIHMRTIGVLAAAILALICFAWRMPSYRKILLAGVVVLAAGLLGGMWIEGVVKDTVYAATDASKLALSDYDGQLGKLREILTLKGMKQLAVSAAGKLYYLGLASFGLFYPAVYAAAKESRKLIGSFKNNTQEAYQNRNGYFYFFLMLSLLGQFMISAVFMMNPDRLDHIVYGRYNEYLLPLFMGTGAFVLMETGFSVRILLGSIGISALLFAVTLHAALHSGLKFMKGFMAPGISYLSYDWDYNIGPELAKAFLFGIMLMCILAGCICIGKRFGKYSFVLGTVLMMEIMLTFCLGRKYTQLFNNVNEYDLQVCEYIAGSSLPVIYLYDDDIPYIDLLQFAMRDRKIEVITPAEVEETTMEEFLPEDGYIIAAPGCGCVEEIAERYRKCFACKDFILFRAE